MALLKDVYVVISGICVYVFLLRERGFQDVIMLKILRWGDDPGLIRQIQCNDMSP